MGVNIGNGDTGGGGGGGIQEVLIRTQEFADLDALNTFAAANLNLIVRTDTEVSIANVADGFVYRWAGVASPVTSYPAGGAWSIAEQPTTTDVSGVTRMRLLMVNSAGEVEAAEVGITPEGNLQFFSDADFGADSIDLGVQTLSNSFGFLTNVNGVNNEEFWLIDHRVPTDSPSSQPRYLRLLHGEDENQGDSNSNRLVISNVNETDLTFPITFPITTTELARTNSLIGEVSSNITNLRFQIRNISPDNSGVSILDWPSLGAWETGQNGRDFTTGEMELRLGNAKLPFSDGRTVEIEIRADSGSLRGSNSGVPVLSTKRQIGQFESLVNARNIVAAFENGTHSGVTVNATLDSDGLPVISLTSTGGGSGGEDNVQSDWNETDNANDAFIRNKPNIPTLPTNIVQSVVAGTNVTIDNSDPANPVINATGGGTPTPVDGPDILYYGLSATNNPASVSLNSLTRVDDATDPQTVSTGVTVQNDYFIILTANTHNISSITDTVLQQDVTNIFTNTDDVRTDSGVTFDSYVIGPLNAGVNESYIVRF